MPYNPNRYLGNRYFAPRWFGATALGRLPRLIGGVVRRIVYRARIVRSPD